ncbi:MAG: MFS transporter, partial [Deltaproteobacteria bacterium]|nr:MFS transporter [Deltaproteobacteria bacterium]
PVAFIVLFVSAVIAFPLWLKISNKTSKKTTYISGLIVFCVSLMIIYFSKDIGPWHLIALMAFAGVGMSTYILFPWAMIPDTVEYSQWKTGIRQEGFLYGFFVFGLKLSQAFAGFFTGTILAHVGYKANEVQTLEALNGIRFLMTIMPCVLITIGILLIVFYPINADMHKKMLEDIGKKK